MFKLLKYLPLLLQLKEVSEIYEQETGKPKPAFISRRFLGVVLLTVSAFLAIHFNVVIPAEIITVLADNLDKVIVALMALYGAVMEVVGIIKRKK